MNLVSEILSLLNKRQLKSLVSLQFLIIVMSFTELVGIASILPFMTIATDPSAIETNEYIKYFYEYFNFSSISIFLIYLGLFVLFLLGISAAISIVTIWKLSIFANQTGTELADTLYSYYLGKNWMYHSSSNSSYLTKQITQEVARITGGILQPFLTVNAKIVFVMVIVTGLLFFNPIISIIVSLVIFLAYISVYFLVSTVVKINGRHISETQEKRYKTMNDTFQSIKEIILLGRSSRFKSVFSYNGKILANSLANNFVLAHVPRYFIEFVGFGIAISLIIILLIVNSNLSNDVIPILSLYAIAAFKLLPACQQIYYSAVTMQGNIAALQEIREDIIEAKNLPNSLNKNETKRILTFKNSINFKNISFTYPDKKHKVINNINLEIKYNQMIGIAGASGAGKSTVIDILMGLLEPNQGSLEVDGVVIDKKNMRSWRNNIGLVPQNIILLDGTIIDNVCFGLTKEEIKEDKIINALKLSNLYDFVMDLDNKLETVVGENGVKFSGGERQRLGIARALYHNPSVLVFDEATSALDNLTEQKIIENIFMLREQKTIITIAHRLSTIRSADQIYFLKKGMLTGSGTYDELYSSNTDFKRLADLS